MTAPESWFVSVTTEDLEQGDLFFDLPIIVPRLRAEDVPRLVAGDELVEPAHVISNNVVLLTQSCDLERPETDSVIVCPAWKFEEVGFNRSKKEQVRKGYLPGFHLLNEDSDLDLPFLVIEFARLMTVTKSALHEFARLRPDRPRLVSPYKEHLSQSFARYFMRVGLPSNIPPF